MQPLQIEMALLSWNICTEPCILLMPLAQHAQRAKRTCRATRRPGPAMASRSAAAAAWATGGLPAASCRSSSSSPSSGPASPPSGLRARMAAVRCQYASNTLVSGVYASCAREDPCNTCQRNY